MVNDYVKELMKRDSEEENLLALISGMALSFMNNGADSRLKGDYDLAKEYYAVAWAFNYKQEFHEGMVLCDKLLKILGADEFELMKLHEFGTSRVDYSISLLTCVEDKFSKKRTFNFTPPFELS